MKTKGLNFTLDVGTFEKFNKICTATNETKVDLLRRLINNELANIEGHPQDIVSGVQSIVEQKLNDIHADIKTVFSGINYLVKYLIQTSNINTRLTVKKFNIPQEEVNQIIAASTDFAKTRFDEAYKTIISRK